MTMTSDQKATLQAIVADLFREYDASDINDITGAVSRHGQGCRAAAELLERRYLSAGPANAADSIDWGSVATDGR